MSRRRLRCGTGVDLERAQADGKISTHDADEIRHFADFLKGLPQPRRDGTPEERQAFRERYAEFYPDDYARGMAEAGRPVVHAIVRQVNGPEQDTLCTHEAVGRRTDDVDEVTCDACLKRIREWPNRGLPQP